MLKGMKAFARACKLTEAYEKSNQKHFQLTFKVIVCLAT